MLDVGCWQNQLLRAPTGSCQPTNQHPTSKHPTSGFNMLLELRGIQKQFGGVHALSDGNLAVAAGEAHLLLGENGAGKSTLMKIVAGMYERDAGQMLWDGREVRLSTPAHAAAIGIAMVHQESLLAPHLSVAENI